jgi:hypothetical protein
MRVLAAVLLGLCVWSQCHCDLCIHLLAIELALEEEQRLCHILAVFRVRQGAQKCKL